MIQRGKYYITKKQKNTFTFTLKEKKLYTDIRSHEMVHTKEREYQRLIRPYELIIIKACERPMDKTLINTNNIYCKL